MFCKTHVIDTNAAVINNTLEIELTKISNRLKLIADILQIFIVKFFDKDKEIFDAMRTLDDKLKKAEEINI